jgi:hypothetical protein
MIRYFCQAELYHVHIVRVKLVLNQIIDHITVYIIISKNIFQN